MLSLPLILAIISCLISVTLANNGCNDAMLNMRISNTDFPNLWGNFSDVGSTIPNFTVIQHCRAHSFTSPKWIESTVLALNISNSNNTYYAVLHYNSCNEITSMFADPIILIPVTHIVHNSNSTGNLVYTTTNPRADFCYNCIDNATLKYCQACNSTCMTEEMNDLDFCYGPSGDECCRYIENDDCVASCAEGSSVDEMSTCILNHLCIRDNPCSTGNCTELSPTTYNCTCPVTHIGVNCSIKDPCHNNNTNQCSGNGNCIVSDSQPYFTCKCVIGVEGDRCQYNRLCNMSVSPCMNNGTCNVMDADNYMCSCGSGYSGVNCETSLAAAPLIGAVVAAVVAFVAIAIIIVLIVIICVIYFYIKGKKGKVEISKKTSKVYPTNGNDTIAEKEPMLDKEKQ